MALDLDTFLVALYTFTDDLYRQHCAPCKPKRRGRRPKLSDGEVLVLLVLGQWLRWSEPMLLRYAQAHWHGYFPRLLTQSAFNKRGRDLAGVLVYLIPAVAQALGAHLGAYQVFDGTPIPLMKRCRGEHSRLFTDEAGIGKGGSDKQWYYGLQLLLAVSDEGVITGFTLGPANTEGHWLAESLLCWRADPQGTPWGPDELGVIHRWSERYVGPKGPLWPRAGAGEPSRATYLADSGFRGLPWAQHWASDYGAWVLTPYSYLGDTAKCCRRQHSALRQVVETVISHLDRDFGLPFPGARSRLGLLCRVAAKLLAFNLALWLAHQFERSGFVFATLFPC